MSYKLSSPNRYNSLNFTAIAANPPMVAQPKIYGFQTEHAHEIKTSNEQKPVDEILDNDPITKFKVNLEQSTKIPEYAARGLKGDPDANFFEYLQLGKVPYYIGGPVLAALFNAGAKTHNPQAKITAKNVTKRMAVGVALYYIGAALAKTVVNTPVKAFRGIDLNHPYRDIVDLRAKSASGLSPKKKEYHKVFESVDFTRWDLLFDYDKKDHKFINGKYDKIAKKYGVDENVNDSDATVKPYVKKTIVMARAWKYLLTAGFVTTGIAIAQKEHWDKAFNNNFTTALKQVFLPGSTLKNAERLQQAKTILMNNFVTPFADSAKDLWKTKIGKGLILGTGIATVLGNVIILNKTSARKDKAVEVVSK